jgi:ATP adenylyltransferase
MTLAKPDVDLEDFILNRMRMSHIYQPVMIKTLLQMGGKASVADIANPCFRMSRGPAHKQC